MTYLLYFINCLFSQHALYTKEVVLLMQCLPLQPTASPLIKVQVERCMWVHMACNRNIPISKNTFINIMYYQLVSANNVLFAYLAAMFMYGRQHIDSNLSTFSYYIPFNIYDACHYHVFRSS